VFALLPLLLFIKALGIQDLCCLCRFLLQLVLQFYAAHLHFSTATHSQVTGEQGQCQGFWPGECVSDLWEERSGFTGFFLKHFSYYSFFRLVVLGNRAAAKWKQKGETNYLHIIATPTAN